ncbi:MAG TPA: hypothetical protein VD862_03095 [Candidatus Paceibacterota bacterium]|nr:hypothetical protein [Candidatus Paceibacterota bacterium]
MRTFIFAEVVMDIEIDDMLEGPDRMEMEAVLEFANFTIHDITRSPVPGHIRRWIDDMPPSMVGEAGLRHPRYYRVRTSVGSFGVLFGPYPAVDLYGTGVRVADIVAKIPETTEGFPFLPLRDLDAVVNLWQRLLELQAGTLPE